MKRKLVERFGFIFTLVYMYIIDERSHAICAALCIMTMASMTIIKMSKINIRHTCRTHSTLSIESIATCSSKLYEYGYFFIPSTQSKSRLTHTISTEYHKQTTLFCDCETQSANTKKT